MSKSLGKKNKNIYECSIYVKMNSVNITTNWTVNTDLNKCSKTCSESDFQGFNEEDLDASNCVQITRPNAGSEPPQISISLVESNKFITRLIFVSQSKRIEVFQGTFENPGSYIKTISGNLCEDSEDDFKVYKINEHLQESKKSQMNIKLTGITDSCWILTLIIVTQIHKRSADRFDLTSINPDLNLSDNAKDFKKLFETFQKTNTPSNMMEMLQPSLIEVMKL